jgi:hypothetical protein
MDIKQRRMEILRRVGSGELGLTEGNRLLHELEQGIDASSESAPVILLNAPAAPANTASPAAPARPAEPAKEAVEAAAPEAVVSPKQPVNDPPLAATGEVVTPAPAVSGGAQRSPVSGWRSLWVALFLFGLLITLFAATWIYQGFLSAGLSWGFWLSFIPFGLGVLLMWAGWELRLARWLHVRVRQGPGKSPQNINLGIPLPIGLTRWAVRHFGRFSPVPGQDIGDFLDEMDRAVANEGPMHIQVEERDGDEVEIWIEGRE